MTSGVKPGLLNRLSIGARVWLGFGLILAILGGFAGTALLAMRDGETRFKQFAQTSLVTKLVMQIDRDMVWLRRNVIAYTQAEDPKALDSGRATQALLKSEIFKATQEIANPNRKKLMEEVRSSFDAYSADFARVIETKTKVDKAKTDILAGLDEAIRVSLAKLADQALARQDLANALLISRAQNQTTLLRLHANEFLENDDPKAGTAMTGDLANAKATLETLGAQVPDVEGRSRVTEALAILARYQAAFDDIHHLHLDLIALVNKKMAGEGEKLAEAISAIVASASTDSAATEARALQELENSSSLGMGLAGAGLVFGLLFATLISRGITGPISTITAAMARFGGGDTRTEIPAQGRGDEIGSIARSVERFRVGLLRTAELEAEAKRLADEADAAARRSAEEQAVVIGGIEGALRAMVEGDLTHRVTTPFAGQYENLRQAINTTFEQLSEVIDEVGDAAKTIDASTVEVAQAADDLSSRTQQQAANLEETAAATEELSTTVKKTANTARQAETRTDAARSTADAGGRIASETIVAMGKIEQSSKEMTSIVDLIEQIAFQTNLLALNAGVEAARAGESGRGFAVVATEVRELAQRCGEAAKRIKDLIVASEGHVGQGVKLVGASAESLTDIASSVGEIAHLVQEISGACREQATGINETSIALSNIDQSTQQNAAMVEETTAAASTLANQAAQLVALVGRFRTAGRRGDTGSRSSAPARSTVVKLPSPDKRPGVAPGAARQRSADTPAKLAVGGDWKDF